jgi:arabinosaccharide transport system substrate-binding protein
MIEKFPYGKAPFWLLVIAMVSSITMLAVSKRAAARRPDLLLVTFTEAHYDAYRQAIPKFEREHHVKVDIEMAHWSSLQSRLQNAILADADVPDMAEMLEDSLGFFTTGPVADVGIVDFTDRFRAEGIDKKVVASRFSLWTAHGRYYAIPHDVHPIMLAYRRDLVEKLGIDVRQLDTWDKFTDVGRHITKDKDGDGVVDQYMLDLPDSGNWALLALVLQHGGSRFDANGNVTLDSEDTVQVIDWYVHQTQGPTKIATDCGWSQPLVKAMTDGLALFVITPDWRSRAFEMEAPLLSGKMALMPLPAWKPGGRRTSVWGGTGLIITKRTKHPELAWELAKYLYFDKSALGERYRKTNIIPPIKEAWDLPEFSTPNPYYSNQPIGKMYAALAAETPTKYSSVVSNMANAALDQTFSRAVLYYKAHGDKGLLDEIRTELKQSVDRVRERVNRDKIFNPGNGP